MYAIRSYYAVDIEDFEPLFAHSLPNNMRLDGLADDWGPELLRERLSFGSDSGTQDGDFQLLLGERADQLYIHMRIVDDVITSYSIHYTKLYDQTLVSTDPQKPVPRSVA